MRNQVEQARRGMSLTLLTTATQRLHFCRPLRHQSATGSIKRLPLDALDVALADHRPIRQKISQNNNGIIHRNGSAGIIRRNNPPEWIRRNNPPEWIRRNRSAHEPFYSTPSYRVDVFSPKKLRRRQSCSVRVSKSI